MLVNATLGFVLWESFGVASNGLEPFFRNHSLVNSVVSGGVAGACQAVVAAPAENLRITLEGGIRGHSWSSAWKDVFREKRLSSVAISKSQQIHEIRKLRSWFQEIGQMAGRGWEGWGWGCAKDAAGWPNPCQYHFEAYCCFNLGFAAFFFIFEISRRTAAKGRCFVENWVSRSHRVQEISHIKQLPAIANGITLVTGGVSTSHVS